MRPPFPTYPQALLDKVNAAEHKPSERERSSQNPIPYVFLILHDRVPDLMPEDCSEDRSPKAPAVYSILAKSTATELALFRDEYSDFFDQEEDMLNFYELGTSDDSCNTVEWGVSARGELKLTAHEAEGEEYQVSAGTEAGISSWKYERHFAIY